MADTTGWSSIKVEGYNLGLAFGTKQAGPNYKSHGLVSKGYDWELGWDIGWKEGKAQGAWPVPSTPADMYKTGYNTGYAVGVKICATKTVVSYSTDPADPAYGITPINDPQWQAGWKEGLLQGCTSQVNKNNSKAKFTIPSGGIKPQTQAPSQAPTPQTPAPGSAPATPSTREPGGGARPETSPTDPIADTRLPPPDREEYQPAAPPAPAASAASSDNTIWWVTGAAGLGLIAWALVAAEKKTGR